MVHAPHRRNVRHARFLLTALLAAGVAFAAPVAARESVDPTTLIPNPPSFIDPVCGWSGQQVICSFDYEFEVVDAPTGVVCNGNELLETTSRHVFGRRIYDAQLRLIARDFAERIDGVLYDPVTGVSVHWTGYDQGFDTFSTPGDPGTGTRMNVGAIIHVYLDSGRSYMLAGGRFYEDVDTGDFDAMGSHPAFDFCAAIDANS